MNPALKAKFNDTLAMSAVECHADIVAELLQDAGFVIAHPDCPDEVAQPKAKKG